MTEHGAVHWNELNTRDVKKAKEFYKKTLGWTYNDMPMGDTYGTYTIIMLGEKMVGGMFEMKSPILEGVPVDSWFTYFAVDDVDKMMKKVKDAGGEVLREPWDVPTVGRIAII